MTADKENKISGCYFAFIENYVRKQKGLTAELVLETLKQEHKLGTNPRMNFYNFDEFNVYMDDVLKGFFPNDERESRLSSIGVFCYNDNKNKQKDLEATFEKEIMFWHNRHPGSELEFTLFDESDADSEIHHLQVMPIIYGRRYTHEFATITKWYYSALFSDIAEQNAAKVYEEPDKEDSNKYCLLANFAVRKNYLGQGILDELKQLESSKKELLLVFDLDRIDHRTAGMEETPENKEMKLNNAEKTLSMLRTCQFNKPRETKNIRPTKVLMPRKY